MTATFADYLQLGVLVVGLVSFGLMMLNRYAVANHNDKLARITAGASNVAGEIRDILNTLPPGVDYATAKAELVAKALPAFAKEFAESASAVGATDAKLTKIISGQVGQIPPTQPAANSNDPTTTVDPVAAAVQTVTNAQVALAALGLAPAPSPAPAPLPAAADATVPLPAPTLPPAPPPLVDPATGLALAALPAAA